ncbi:MAG TPA: DUF3465 domain-containing protein [Candidatus Acidoferrales bacterium]|nr:DUF3465 domain-containing protein [Candidatus Acidoferrales bacterium]
MGIHRRAPSLRYRALALGLALAAAGCSGHPEQPDNARICAAYGSGQSGVEVIGSGTVLALLGTSNGRSGEHEGFLLKLTGQCDLALRIETNVDITGPVPLQPGETVVVKGQFEDDADGGVIHWTHHDPSGRHITGYVEAGGKFYE